jgi:hypothetical protein
MKKKEAYQITANALRVGNQLHYDTGEEVAITTIDWQDIKWCSEKQENFNANHKPLILTESLMRKVRRVCQPDYSMIEFQVTPPGERQIENNYWSHEICDCRRLHLSPSFRHSFVEGKSVKEEIPEFWFVWICAYGTGSNWSLNIKDIHQSPLQYFHQLQNLYHALNGSHLTLRP